MTMDSQAIQQLPTVNRNPTPSAQSDGDPSARGVGVSFKTGLRSAGTNVLLDEQLTTMNSQPRLAKRFRWTQSRNTASDVTAEYGPRPSVVVNLATKSGSNQFHGSVNRVSALATENFFDKATDKTEITPGISSRFSRRPDQEGQTILLWKLGMEPCPQRKERAELCNRSLSWR